MGAASNQHQTCASADVRPFGLGTYRQKVYVGLVCSAFSTQLAANLRAYVYVLTWQPPRLEPRQCWNSR